MCPLPPTSASPSVSVPGRSRIRMVLKLLGAALVVLALSAFAWWYHCAHRSDSVVVDIETLPSDTANVWIACEEGGRVRLLREYTHDLLYYCYEPHRPRAEGRATESVYLHCVALEWREAETIVVIWRDVHGKWFRRSIGGDRIVSAPAEGEHANGRRILKFAVSDITRPADADFLRGLGLFQGPDPGPAIARGNHRLFSQYECLGIRCSFDPPKDLDQAASLLDWLRFLVHTHSHDEALKRAKELCEGATLFIPSARGPSSDEDPAVREFQESYPRFVAAIEKDRKAFFGHEMYGSIDDANAVLDGWERLLERLSPR